MQSTLLEIQIRRISHQKIMSCVSLCDYLIYPIFSINEIKCLSTGDNEQRALIQPQSLNDPQVKQLQQILIDWINDELADERIIVKNIEEDLYDGQVTASEKLAESGYCINCY